MNNADLVLRRDTGKESTEGKPTENTIPLTSLLRLSQKSVYRLLLTSKADLILSLFLTIHAFSLLFFCCCLSLPRAHVTHPTRWLNTLCHPHRTRTNTLSMLQPSSYRHRKEERRRHKGKTHSFEVLRIPIPLGAVTYTRNTALRASRRTDPV